MTHYDPHLVTYEGKQFCECECWQCCAVAADVMCICPDGCQCGEH